jgi:hypothetical protein
LLKSPGLFEAEASLGVLLHSIDYSFFQAGIVSEVSTAWLFTDFSPVGLVTVGAPLVLS